MKPVEQIVPEVIPAVSQSTADLFHWNPISPARDLRRSINLGTGSPEIWLEAETNTPPSSPLSALLLCINKSLTCVYERLSVVGGGRRAQVGVAFLVRMEVSDKQGRVMTASIIIGISQYCRWNQRDMGLPIWMVERASGDLILVIPVCPGHILICPPQLYSWLLNRPGITGGFQNHFGCF